MPALAGGAHAECGEQTAAAYSSDDKRKKTSNGHAGLRSVCSQFAASTRKPLPNVQLIQTMKVGRRRNALPLQGSGQFGKLLTRGAGGDLEFGEERMLRGRSFLNARTGSNGNWLKGPPARSNKAQPWEIRGISKAQLSISWKQRKLEC